VSCSGQDFGFFQPMPKDLARVFPLSPDISDYRHFAKHVPLPNVGAEQVSADVILSWSQDPIIPQRAKKWPGLDIFHIATSYLHECARLRCFYAPKAGYDKMTTIVKITLKGGQVISGRAGFRQGPSRESDGL
jgi:hypothetical protein